MRYLLALILFSSAAIADDIDRRLGFDDDGIRIESTEPDIPMSFDNGLNDSGELTPDSSWKDPYTGTNEDPYTGTTVNPYTGE